MKTSYILKTSNDLTFEFDRNELLWDDWIKEYDYVRNIFEREDFPKKLTIDDEIYTINYFSKVKHL